MPLKDDVIQYVLKHIGEFHARRLESINSLSLKQVLSRKNPYLYRAKNLTYGADIVRVIVDAHLSSQEETVFGNWLEGLAIFVNEIVFGGVKSGIAGIDLEFNKDGIRYLVVIKSGPKWGNKGQTDKMKLDFVAAQRTLRTSGALVHTRLINGCCYGKENVDKGIYEKVCGQKFWELISGNADLYTDIVEPLGHEAQIKNDEFAEQYGKALNRLTIDFMAEFCNPDASINWQKIVQLSSMAKKPKAKGKPLARNRYVRPEDDSIAAENLSAASKIGTKRKPRKR